MVVGWRPRERDPIRYESHAMTGLAVFPLPQNHSLLRSPTARRENRLKVAAPLGS
jgi:hypothetical protein